MYRWVKAADSYLKVINLHFTIHPSNFCHLLLRTNELIKVQIEHRERDRIARKSMYTYLFHKLYTLNLFKPLDREIMCISMWPMNKYNNDYEN